MLLATPNQPILLSQLAADGREDLFGQARIYNSSNTLVASVSTPHVAEGLYSGLYTPTAEGYYTIVYQLYFDAGLTTDAGYEKGGESLDVNSVRTNIQRIAGLTHENSLVDMNVYDSNGNLTSARLRVYDSAANVIGAQAVSPSAYNTGLLFVYTVTATYSGTQLATYHIARVQ